MSEYFTKPKFSGARVKGKLDPFVNFRSKKEVIKSKDDKLYVKWKGYDNTFKSWIDKKTKYK